MRRSDGIGKRLVPRTHARWAGRDVGIRAAGRVTRGRCPDADVRRVAGPSVSAAAGAGDMVARKARRAPQPQIGSADAAAIFGVAPAAASRLRAARHACINTADHNLADLVVETEA